MLDVNCGEDGYMARKDNAVHNLSPLKVIVLDLFRSVSTDKFNISRRQKRKRPAWDGDDGHAGLRETMTNE
jgi:hypothetical protein